MKDIKGYEGLYGITECGRVISYGGKSNHLGDIELKASYDKDGYRKVSLQKDKDKRTFRVNRLVASAYIPNPCNKPMVNHKNEIKDDDNASNLEWVTGYENWLHSNPDKEISVVKICKDTGDVLGTYCSLMEAARDNNINQGNITNCLKGRCKSVGGFYWRQF